MVLKKIRSEVCWAMPMSEWQPLCLAPSFGVELRLDLSRVGPEEARDLLIALRRFKLVLVRGQALEEPAYVRLGERLGRLWTVDDELGGNAEAPHAVGDHTEIARVSNKGGMLQDRPVDWHGDLAHHPSRPYPGRILHARAMPSDAVTVTSWVDLEHGWNFRLSDEDRGLVAGREGEFRAGYETLWGTTRHAVVRRHPARGAEWLGIDRAFFKGFVGMDAHASARLKKRLLSRMIVGSAMYRHTWQEGDTIIYDNEGTMHRRERVWSSEERTIWRLTLEYAWAAVA
jgi:alpha-ketoglutarate-dependent taurine dioxygenase